MGPADESPLASQAPGSGSVRVVSKRKGGRQPAQGETVVDVDRTHPVLGNRHFLRDHRSRVERDRAIALHAEDLARDVAVEGPMFQALVALAHRVAGGERIALRCWCAVDGEPPVPCHADAYRRAIYSLAGMEAPVQASVGAAKPASPARTGWPPPPLAQDDDRRLFRWFASKPDARVRVREAAQQIPQTHTPDQGTLF